jgi:hypothetical protein
MTKLKENCEEHSKIELRKIEKEKNLRLEENKKVNDE